jgi:hypothetical protein
MISPKGPKNETEFAKLLTQPLAYRRNDPLIHIQSEPELNPMTQETADKFYRTSPSKIDRIALVAMTETAFTPQAFAALQEADLPIRSKRNQLELLKFEQTDERGFFLRNGIVMHEYQDKNSISHPAVVVPAVLVPVILQSYHITVLGGHQSRAKIENDLKRKFYWPHMKTAIKDSCQACVPCAYNKRYPVGFPQGKLIVPSYPNHIVFMDVTGGLPLSYDGCHSLLLIFDGFSKFAFGIPLKSEKAAYAQCIFWPIFVRLLFSAK